MQQQQSHLDRIFVELGITSAGEYHGRMFYDTNDAFDRHNFARDLKRCVNEGDWILNGSKYLVSKEGILVFAYKKGSSKVASSSPSSSSSSLSLSSLKTFLSFSLRCLRKL
jgi:hypothetical protein